MDSRSTPGARSARRLPIAWCAAALLVVGFVVQAPASTAATEIGQASTSREVREAAVQSIPFDKLTPQAKAKITDVVTRPSIYRRMPMKVIDCDPDMYLFLVRHPEVIVNIWELMGVTSVAIERTGPYQFKANDGSGTVSDVELVYGSADTHVLYATGSYAPEGPLVRNPLTGRCVLLLKTGYARTADDRVHVTSRLDVFVAIDNAGLDLVARTINPLVGRTADYNFLESTGFVGRVSLASERNGAGVRRLASQLEGVEPAVRERFAELALAVHQKAILRDAELAARGGQPPIEGELFDPAQPLSTADLRAAEAHHPPR